MWKFVLCLLLMIPTLACGYKVVGWSSSFSTLAITPVSGGIPDATLKMRMRDSLMERCLAGSGLKPVDKDGDLRLSSWLKDYREQVIATDVDGRTERYQFTILLSFELTDKQGQVLWSLRDYQYSDQYSISTTQASFKDESVFEQDKALRSIADLVITNITLAIAELEAT